MKIDRPTKKLTEVCDIVYGFAFKANEFNEAGKGLPVIRIGDVDKSETNKSFDGKYDEKYLVKKGDILLGLSGSFKAARWEGDTALLNQRVATLRTFENKTTESFVFYQLPGLFVQFEKTITHLSVKNILTKHLENLKMLYPSLKTQKQIVGRMEKIAEARKLNDELIQKSDELFQSLLHQELNPAGKNWETNKLGEICEINPSKPEINRFPDDLEIGFLTMADVSEDAEMINVQTRKLKEVKKGFTYFRNGDVLFAKITPCMENGKGALAEGMKNGIGFGSTEFHVLRAKPEFVLNKLLYFIANDKSFRKNAQKYMRGAVGQQRVPSDYIEKFKIPLPPINLQKQIVEKLSAAQEYKKQLLAQKSFLKELFDSVLYKSMKGEMNY